MQDFLGINTTLGLDKISAAKNIPAASSKILKRLEDSANFDGAFNYRLVVGQLNYVEKGTRMDIACSANQCARFTESPIFEHGLALRWIG